MAFFLPALKSLGFLDTVSMTLCNVGSRKLSDDDDYGAQHWKYFIPNLTIYGFDADEEACAEANLDLAVRNINWQEIHLPIAIAAKTETRTLYVTKALMCSSLYPPDEAFLSRFPSLPPLVNLDYTTTVETQSLDAVCQSENIKRIDFLQVDVQGADLEVLKGAEQMLAQGVIAIQTEVEFAALYQGQPLFAEVDQYLRSQGFSLFDLTTPARQPRSGLVSQRFGGQVLWADAIYLRDVLALDTQTTFKTPAEILKVACVADALEFTDYALELLEHLTIHYHQDPAYNLAPAIVASLAQIPDLAEVDIAALPICDRIRAYL
jgi:FkbM family methyltransferase